MTPTTTSKDRLRARLDPILRELRRQELVDHLAEQDTSRQRELVQELTRRQGERSIANRIRNLHASEIAHLLEMVPPEERHIVWRAVPEEAGGNVLWQVSESVAEWLVRHTSQQRLVAMCQRLDADDLAQVADHLPPEIRAQVYEGLEARLRDWVESSLAWPEDSVGELMTPDLLEIPHTATVKDAFKTIRARGDLPDQTDKLFVVDERRRLVGLVRVHDLLLHRPRSAVAEFMKTDMVIFTPEDAGEEAAQAFERYDLVSAPVVDDNDRPIGRLTVDVVMDFVREEAEKDALQREGLKGDEDLFGPVFRGARSRWTWLGINLLTAFVASRVIGVFESSIEQLVALATLMPIVASIGGNTGNQTVALVIRGLALDQVKSGNLRYLALKELAVALINGLLWGSVIGAVAWLLYGNPMLGFVMGLATLLNLLVAAGTGVAVPIVMHRSGRDPALGSSVVLTFVTDGMGFMIFLGLATALLLGAV